MVATGAMAAAGAAVGAMGAKATGTGAVAAEASDLPPTKVGARVGATLAASPGRKGSSSRLPTTTRASGDACAYSMDEVTELQSVYSLISILSGSDSQWIY